MELGRILTVLLLIGVALVVLAIHLAVQRGVWEALASMGNGVHADLRSPDPIKRRAARLSLLVVLAVVLVTVGLVIIAVGG